MADNSLEILIKTKADLAGAQAAGAQLEQDAAKAKALGEAMDSLGETPAGAVGNGRASGDVWAARDVREKNALEATDAAGLTQASAAASGIGPAIKNEQDVAEASDTEADRGADWENGLSRFEAGIDGLRSAVAVLSQILAGKSQLALSADEVTDFSGSEVTPASRQSAVAFGQEENGFDSSPSDRDAQAIESSGERLRAAMEEHTRMTVSLFNRTLELMGRQNRELEEVGRKLTELGGQMKSLKNL